MLPSGTVTFLFTDIEGSTPLWERMPVEMQEAVAQHHAILRRVIEANGGHVFQILGDAFQAAFRLPREGLCAAVDAQRALQTAIWGPTGPILVRMGLHTGTAELDAIPGPSGIHEYAVSHTLNRAARVMSAGYGGQIILSQETKNLVERSLSAGERLIDLGEHHLKGMLLPEHLYQVVAPGLPETFPPLGTNITPPNNLPLQLSSFVGRKKEIARIKELLQTSRLVSLTGAGGVGKTRLALLSAEEVLDDFPKGVWLVELAPVGDPALVAQAAADVLSLRASQGKNILEVLLDYLRHKRLLLIFDNCEHLIEGCAGVAEVILRSCPEIRLLATSREALGIEGEKVMHVPSLSIPDQTVVPSLDEIREYEAVQLFMERARAILPEFEVTKDNAASLAQVCQRLDGIPLALELAASRLKIFSIGQIASRLHDRFRLLAGGSRRSLPRHQTLTALIDWSYGLLSPEEQALFRCLSVFSGGWTIEAAEAIWGDDLTDNLTRLVDKSLVLVVPAVDEQNRYRMLETIRQYAQAKLLEVGEAEDIRNRHLDFFTGLAEECEPRIVTGERLSTFQQLRADLENIRSALDWSLNSEDGKRIEKGLRLAIALGGFWIANANGREIILLMENGLKHLDLVNGIPPRVLAKAYFTIGAQGLNMNEPGTIHFLKEGRELAFASGDLWVYVFCGVMLYTWTLMSVDVGIEPSLIDECLELARKIGEHHLLAHTLYFHSYEQKDIMDWEREVNEAVGLFNEAGNRWDAQWVRNKDGRRAAEVGNYHQAKVIFEESLKLTSELGDLLGLTLDYQNLGALALREGNYSEMEWYFQAAYEADANAGCPSFQNLIMLGYAVLVQGDIPRAGRIFKESRSLIIPEMKNNSKEHLVLVWACLAKLSGVPQVVARCLGGLTSWLGNAPVELERFWIAEDKLYEQCLNFCREQLEKEVLEKEWRNGSLKTPDTILDEMENLFLSRMNE